MEKKQYRNKLRKVLQKIEQNRRAQKSTLACQKLTSTREFKDASVIMIYLSLPHEPDTTQAILSAWEDRKFVAVPKVFWEDKHMIPVQINSLDADFSTEVSGLRNPIKGIPVPLADIDLVVTPALGFDKQGNRLGRGGAYYDRFFDEKNLRTKRCGFGFSEQVVEKLPVTKMDIPLHLLVTDKKIWYFNNRKGQ